MASLLIKGGRVVSPEDGLDGNLDVLVENGVVRRVAPDLALLADETLDARGQVVSPGFIDLHINGFAGVDFLTAEPDDYAAVGGALAATGVTAYLPTFVTSPVDAYRPALQAVSDGASGGGPGGAGGPAPSRWRSRPGPGGGRR